MDAALNDADEVDDNDTADDDEANDDYDVLVIIDDWWEASVSE